MASSYSIFIFFFALDLIPFYYSVSLLIPVISLAFCRNSLLALFTSYRFSQCSGKATLGVPFIETGFAEGDKLVCFRLTKVCFLRLGSNGIKGKKGMSLETCMIELRMDCV